ncbi:putative leader peptide [Modestobacter sp. VKM Ac-2981]
MAGAALAGHAGRVVGPSSLTRRRAIDLMRLAGTLCR